MKILWLINAVLVSFTMSHAVLAKTPLEARAVNNAEPEILRRRFDERTTNAWQNTTKQRVAVSLPIHDYMQVFEDAPNAEFESREYWFRVSGYELQKGVTLKTTAPGAVIRVSGADGMGKAQIMSPDSLFISENLKTEKTVRMASVKVQQAQGADDPILSEGTLAFKLDKTSEIGNLTLRGDLSMNARAEYLVHVFEPESQIVYKAGVQTPTILSGSLLSASGVLQNANVMVAGSNATATLIAPDGRRMALNTFTSERVNKVAESIAYPVAQVPGLWEIEWKILAQVDGLNVERQIRTAFAYGINSAQINGQVRIKNKARDAVVRIQVPVQVSQAGRFEVRATASQRIGDDYYPVQFLSTAQWLTPGKQVISLELNKSLLRAHGVTGDINVQGIQLLDQTQMLSLQERSEALRIAQRAWH